MKMELREIVLKHALLNAIKYNGKASEKIVIGKAIAEVKDKSKVEEIVKLAKEIVEYVNSLSVEEQKKIFKEKFGEIKEEKRKEKEKIPKAGGRVVTRFAPNPNGPLHLGHVRAALISYEFAKKNNGKFILRFEDTNPRNVIPSMYDAIKQDLKWLGINWHAEYVQSQRLSIYYKYAEILIKEGKAYVCECDKGKFRKLKNEGKPCKCRAKPSLNRWRKMINGDYDEGQAVLRLKTDLKHENPAVRDFPIMRVVKHEHPLAKGYYVWPLYNFACAIDDHLMQITHVFRGKEHSINTICQSYIFKYLNWKMPEIFEYGRLSIKNAELSKSKIVEGIKQGKYEGFDDVKLATIAALRRRGFQAEAIRNLILDVGLKRVDVEVTWQNLESYNRKVVDKIANRYFLVYNPMLLKVCNAPSIKQISLPLHPDLKERGKRKIEMTIEGKHLVFYVNREDMINKKVVRLKDLFNVEVVNVKDNEIIAKFAGKEIIRGVPKIQWIPKRFSMKIKIIKPDGIIEGLCEPNCIKEIGKVVQFERVCFARIEKVENKKIIAYYAHK